MGKRIGRGFLLLLIALFTQVAWQPLVVRAQEPVTPEYTLDLLLDEELGAQLSPEAKQILGRPYTPVPAYFTYKDTLFYPALFTPLIFDVTKSQRLYLPERELRKSYDAASLLKSFLPEPAYCEVLKEQREQLEERFPYFQMMARWEKATELREEIFLEQPNLVGKTYADLPEDRIGFQRIQGVGYQGELAVNEIKYDPVTPDLLEGEKVERKYWIHSFNASAHFSQNQISDNWHKGGFNSLNLNSRLYYNATYEKDDLRWVNALEYKLGLFTNQDDAESRRLKISKDVFRANSNLGLRAFKNWYYTLDAQLRSQLMKNMTRDSVVTTRPFAPIIADAGLGMKYDIDLKNFRGNPFQRVRFSANIAPIAATLIYTYSDDIDKKRIGLKEDERMILRLGSTIRLNLAWDFSSKFHWTSRFFYNTSYSHVEAEFENRLTYAFSNYLSTTFNLILRYDDSVILEEPKNFKNLLQYNELFSFGFEYRF